MKNVACHAVQEARMSKKEKFEDCNSYIDGLEMRVNLIVNFEDQKNYFYIVG